jgi:hypothetical protein
MLKLSQRGISMDGKAHFDRTTEDLGNIVNLGHVNVFIPDQGRATLFYVAGLGLTRDPYLMTSTNNMWINVGMSQFHLPTGKPHVLRGVTGLVIADHRALVERLQAVSKELDGSEFAFVQHDGVVDTVCPWGNRIRCHEPDKDRFGEVALGMAYVAFDVPAGTAPRIGRFYREIFEAPAELVDDAGNLAARVQVGHKQYLVFRETAGALPPFDGHHLQIYVGNFSGPYRRLGERGLVSEESSQVQYRFKDIVDLDSGEPLYTIEHEVRSMTHPLYGRPLVNRNPAQNIGNYAPGFDARAWAIS